jgi:hypothetical protein
MAPSITEELAVMKYGISTTLPVVKLLPGGETHFIRRREYVSEEPTLMQLVK